MVREEFRFPCEDGGVRAVRLFEFAPDWFQVDDAGRVVWSGSDAAEARRAWAAAARQAGQEEGHEV